MGRLGPGIISSDDTTTPAVATTTEILSTSQGGWGQDISGETGLVFVNAGTPVFISSIVDVAGYATDGDGTSGDPWTGWDTAITWTGGYVYWLRPGHFKTTTTLNLTADYTRLVGSGRRVTTLWFEPTANDTCIEFSNGASSVWGSGLEGIAIRSTDSTYTKIGIDTVDVRGFTLRDVEVSGTVVVGETNMWSGGAGSISLRTRGRESFDMDGFWSYADRPIVVSDNPNAVIDCDHHHFEDCELTANGNPCVEIESGVNVSHLTFDGRQAWAKGTDGLKWVDTETSTVGIGLRLSNVRWEQEESPTGYFLDIEHNYSLYQLLVQNCYGGTSSRGFKLRYVRDADFSQAYYVGTGVALDADNTCNRLKFAGCFFQTGGTLITTGLTKVIDSGQSTVSGLLNDFVLYDVPTYDTNAVLMVNATITGRATIPVVETASLPAASGANDGLILIEDNGVGDRNLVVYGGGQRFRIDGGAAF